MSEANWGRAESYTLGPVGSEFDVFSNTQISTSEDATTVTLHFFKTYGSGSPPPNADVHAIVEYQQGQASSRFECDWRGSIVLPCRGVSVRAQTYAPSHRSSYDVGVGTYPVRLGVMLAAGSTKSFPATYTTGWQEMGSEAATFTVPPFARRWRPRFVRNPGTDAVPPVLDELPDMLAIWGDELFHITPDVYHDGLVLHPACAEMGNTGYLELYQLSSASHIYGVRSVFELDL